MNEECNFVATHSCKKRSLTGRNCVTLPVQNSLGSRLFEVGIRVKTCVPEYFDTC